MKLENVEILITYTLLASDPITYPKFYILRIQTVHTETTHHRVCLTV